jgi:Ca-activated chloride channel family protein
MTRHGSGHRYRAAALALLLAAGGATPDVRALGPDILLLAPKEGEPVFGTVEVRAEVLSSETVAEVEFLVDGRSVAKFEAPPYQTTVDVGQDNREHRFEVRVWTLSGTRSHHTRTTPALQVDEALDLELQQLYVTVLDAAGRPALDLPQERFRVEDNGLLQTLVTFARGDVPFTAVLLADASRSMAGERLRLAIAGARSFVQGMRRHDEAALYLFSDRLLFASPFASDAGPLEEALTTVQAQGGTALNDHLYLALKQLEARQGRRVVVLLSDGIDIESALTMEEVLFMVRRSQVLIYWIRLLHDGGGGVIRFSSWRDPAGHRREEELLTTAVRESGGRIVPIRQLEEATRVFDEILGELRNQYVLGYYPSRNDNDGSWHRVQVQVPGGAQVRAREGYIDY